MYIFHALSPLGTFLLGIFSAVCGGGSVCSGGGVLRAGGGHLHRDHRLTGETKKRDPITRRLPQTQILCVSVPSVASAHHSGRRRAAVDHLAAVSSQGGGDGDQSHLDEHTLRLKVGERHLQDGND